MQHSKSVQPEDDTKQDDSANCRVGLLITCGTCRNSANFPNAIYLASMIFFLAFFIIFCSANGLRAEFRKKDGDELIPDYSEFYYYHNLHEKMGETLSISNCTSSGDFTGFEPEEGGVADFQIRVIPPSKALIERWGSEGSERHNVSKIYVRTNPILCASRPFIKYKKGGILFAKGCLKMYQYNKDGEREKVINRYGATLHPEHVRCDCKQASIQCVAASQHLLQLPDELRSLHSYPFMMTAKNAIVSRSGFLALPCGPLGLFASCESVKYGVPSSTALIDSIQACRNANSVYENGAIGDEKCPFPIHDRVFVMTQYDDTQIGQFVQEALPKLVYNLDFILANPDIKIHFGFTKQKTIPNFVLPNNIFNWLGLGDRLINGTVYAKEAYMPREGGCQDVGYNAWEFVATRDKFLDLAGVDQNLYGTKRSVVVIRRTSSKYVANHGDYKQRTWPKKMYVQMLESLTISFPNHRIDIYSDGDSELMKCRECQIRMFHDADVVLAIHGAGLTNTMFMRPGGVVVEVIPMFDTRHAPLTGIFPRLSGIIGLNHYTYSSLENINNVDAVDLVSETLAFAFAVGVQL